MRCFAPFLVFLLIGVSSPLPAQTQLAQWTEHLGLNVTTPPLDNLVLRQAIASAIDRQAVFEAAQSKWTAPWTATAPSGSWFPPFLPQHSQAVRIHPYNLAVARELLARAGFPEGRGLPEFEILFRHEGTFAAPRAAEGEAIKTQLAAIGIRVKITGLPTATAFFERVMPRPGQAGQYHGSAPRSRW